MEKDIVVGIDIGGQTSKIGIVDETGAVLARSVIRSDIYGESAEAFVDALAVAVKELIVANACGSRVRGIGVGAPNGNHNDGTISFAPNLEWASNGKVEFSRMLSDRMDGLSVSLTNDANAAAAGEMCYGAAKGMKDFIMITLGTGVGSGIVVDGRIVYGHDGFAGELGHVCAVRDSERVCGCGKKGCLECYCSAPGVVRTALEFLRKSGQDSLLRDLESLSAKDVYEAAKSGDATAVAVFEYTGEILGHSLADFVAFSSPEAIVLFGGVARAEEYLIGAVTKAMNENLMPLWRGKIKVLFSQLYQCDAAILGAAALV